MQVAVRLIAVIAVAACCVMPAAAQIAPTPDGWKPEQAKAKADAYG